MKGLPWFRLYAEIINDPKTGTLSDSEFRTFIELMCLACEAGSEGDTLLTIDQANWKLRRNVTETVSRLIDNGLVTVTEQKTLFVVAWSKRQCKSDTSTDRVRKFRENNQKKQSLKKPKKSETFQKRNDNGVDRDIDKDIDKDIKDSCAEPCSPPFHAEVAEPIITLPLNTGTEHPVHEALVTEFQNLYPAVDVIAQLKAMRGWLITNPGKRKTKAGVNAFMNKWLAKEQDRGGSHESRQPNPQQRLSTVEANSRAAEAYKARLRAEGFGREAGDPGSYGDVVATYG